MSRLAQSVSVAAALSVASLIGCSSGGDVVVDEETQSVDGVDGGPVCTPDDVSWPAGASASERVCEGPWTYVQTKSCLGAFDSCGKIPCSSWKSCYVPISDGGSYVTKISTYKKNYTAWMEYDFEFGPSKPTLIPTVSWMQNDCKAKFNAKKASIAAATAGPWPPGTTSPPALNIVQSTGTYWNLKLKSKVGSKHTYECSYKVTYRQIKKQAHSACGCTHPITNAYCWDYQPACGEQRYYTDLGVSEAGVPAPPTLKVTAHRHSLECTTCEDLPADDPQGKFDCLLDRLESGPLPAVSTPSKQALIRQLKLVFEMYGDQLTPAQQEQARSLYVKTPNWAPTCGPTPYAGLDDECRKAVEDIGLGGPLSACQRMRYQSVVDPITSEPGVYSHVPLGVVDQELEECGKALAQVTELEPDCVEQVRDAFVSIDDDLLGRAFEAVEAGGAPGSLTSVESALAHIHTWYDHATKAWDDNPEGLRANTSSVLRRFWDRVHLVSSPLPDESAITDEATAQVLLDDVAALGLAADRSVLAAAYSDPAPLTSAPLVYITADALQPLADRLTDVGAIQDAACRYMDCDGRTTEVSELWSVIGALRDPAALDDALAAASHIRPEYAAVFAAMRDRNAALAAALAGADPAAEANLVGLIETAANNSSMFAERGLFSSAPNNVLHAGIQEENRTAIQNSLDAAVNRLNTGVSTYRTGRATLVSDLIGVLRNGAEVDDISHRLEDVLLRGFLAGRDRELLKLQDAAAEISIGSMAESFEALIASEAVDSDMYVQTDVLPPLTLNAADDTHFDPTVTAPWVSEIAVEADAGGVWTLDVQKGDIVRFGVTGTWAPACALEKQYGPLPVIPETGSEGYIMEHSDGTSSARSYSSSEERYVHNDTTTKTCYGASANVNVLQVLSAGGVGLGGITASASWNKCKSESEGTRTTTGLNNTETEQSSTQVRLSGGVVAEGTPIHGTAGALFLVATNMPGEPVDPDAIRDLMVVRPNGMFVAHDDLRLYLVVNDRNDCATLSSVGPLVVTPHVLRPLGAVVESLGVAMGDTLTELRTARIDLLAESTQLLPHEVASLKADANQRLALACDCDVTQYPPILRSFFDGWVDHEIARLARQVQVNAISRQLDQIEQTLIALEDDLKNAQERGRLIQLLPHWSLRNLSGVKLRREVDRMTRVLNGMLHPVMHLRYPNALASFRTDNAGLLDSLVDVDFTASFDEHADDLASLAGALSIALDDGDITANNTLVKFAVTFPRPADIQILSPNEGDEIGAGTNVAVRVAFAPNVKQVELYIDSTLVATDTQFPFQFNLLDDLAPGEHTLLVASRDHSDEIIANESIQVAGPEEECVPNPLLGIECPEECVPNPLLGIECPEEGGGTGGGGTGGGDPLVFAVANENATKLAWDGVFSLGVADFVVSPEDVYDAGVFSPLLCGDTVPVIQSMSVFAVADKDAETLNAQNMRLDSEIDPNLQFPDGAGPNHYVMDNADFVTLLGAPIRFGRNESDAVTTHDTWAASLRFANGLSPFTTFSVDFSKFADLDPTFWDNADAFVLVFELDARHSGAGLPWLAPCL